MNIIFVSYVIYWTQSSEQSKSATLPLYTPRFSLLHYLSFAGVLYHAIVREHLALAVQHTLVL